jgi:hypothetical protein
MVCAFRLVAASAGNNSAARMAMMAMTTNNSMRVNALSAGLANLGVFIICLLINPLGQSFLFPASSVFHLQMEIKDCE